MDFMNKMRRGYLTLWKTFIQPRRMAYNVREMLEAYDLENQFHLKLSEFKVQNPYKDRLVGYRYQNLTQRTKKVMIYAHTHSGSSLEGTPMLNMFISQGFDMVCFDFCGNGKSSAQYVTLGCKEKEDLLTVINHCKDKFGYEEFYLWGRSMGASAILLMLWKYEHLRLLIRGIVLDSPFLNLRKLCVLIGQRRTPLPKIVIEGALNIVRGTIMDKAKFDINLVNPVLGVDKINVPAVFIIAHGDEMVPPRKLEKMFKKYFCPYKELMIIKGTHASIRKDSELKKALDFVVYLSQKMRNQKIPDTKIAEAKPPVQVKRANSAIPIVIERKISSIQGGPSIDLRSEATDITSYSKSKEEQSRPVNHNEHNRPATHNDHSNHTHNDHSHHTHTHNNNHTHHAHHTHEPMKAEKERRYSDHHHCKCSHHHSHHHHNHAVETPQTVPKKKNKIFDQKNGEPNNFREAIIKNSSNSSNTPSPDNFQREKPPEKEEEKREWLDEDEEPMITYEFEKKTKNKNTLSDIFFQADEDGSSRRNSSHSSNKGSGGSQNETQGYGEKNQQMRGENFKAYVKNYELAEARHESSGGKGSSYTNSPVKRRDIPLAYHGAPLPKENMVKNSNHLAKKGRQGSASKKGEESYSEEAKQATRPDSGHCQHGRSRGGSINRGLQGDFRVDEGVVLGFRENPGKPFSPTLPNNPY